MVFRTTVSHYGSWLSVIALIRAFPNARPQKIPQRVPPGSLQCPPPENPAEAENFADSPATEAWGEVSGSNYQSENSWMAPTLSSCRLGMIEIDKLNIFFLSFSHDSSYSSFGCALEFPFFTLMLVMLTLPRRIRAIHVASVWSSGDDVPRQYSFHAHDAQPPPRRTCATTLAIRVASLLPNTFLPAARMPYNVKRLVPRNLISFCGLAWLG